MTRGRPRPWGEPTRGTTAPNRLRRVDRYLIARLAPLLRRTEARLVVDVGYGATAVTTVELFDRLRTGLGPQLRVTGVELDPARVAAGRQLAARRTAGAPPDGSLQFVHGGFELPVGEAPLAVRALNVLRQYDEDRVTAAWRGLVDRLDPEGILVEGTCDETGRRGAWVTVYAADPRGPGGQVVPRTLTLAAQLRTLSRPGELAERLPKALIHHNVPGESVHDLLARLDHAWDASAPQRSFGQRQRWLATITAVRAQGISVLDGPGRWRLGELTVPWSVVAPASRPSQPG
ncbi:MAG: class I SAM-dependent methyltransferase [Actinomycetota bacterium]|nr:MAG: class I SAM-dependent methyltransferase [Actinomycetota bacterium]